VEPHVSDIVRIIQLVVAPVFLLTAVGTILNALNMRLGRAVDRRRVLEEKRRAFANDEAQAASDELAQIGRRIRYVYFAILFAVLSALFVCLLIAGAFVGALASAELTRTIAAMFVLAMLALIVSLLAFLREIFLAVSSPRHVSR
jgi:NADH:ubiquinone oxidoreductase subunit 3 (subunit A)